MSTNLPKMKPMFTKNTKYEITFDRFEGPIKHRPIVIFRDEYAEITEDGKIIEKYYYIKARSAHDENGNIKIAKKGEIFLEKATIGLLTNDSYVDTTQIYSIKKEELNNIVDRKNVIFASTNDLTKYQIDKIYRSVLKNLTQEPPYVSFMDVKLNNKTNAFVGELKYSHEYFLDQDYFKSSRKDKKKFMANILNKKNLIEETLIELRNLKNGVREEFSDILWEWEYVQKLEQEKIEQKRLQNIGDEKNEEFEKEGDDFTR
ncbi:Mbov_0400 family ICE element protein [Mesomycoplasma neurolyticum]|uniref:Uncharacterized protein n=1 Tax=Mesomycoplasma neurolyticum TaxID=2120 RepID=A0A449A521_9BACT|nr:hypothetical protein [Mesomycoplasma neurolyticum]VEU59345.1 Uncharacterised protein [Mesomycoplasma neurolyticum]